MWAVVEVLDACHSRHSGTSNDGWDQRSKKEKRSEGEREMRKKDIMAEKDVFVSELQMREKEHAAVKRTLLLPEWTMDVKKN